MSSYDISKPIIGIVIGTTVALVAAGIGAINGIITSYTISYISGLSPFIAGLSPIIVGGIIGVGLLIPILSIYELAEDLISGSEKSLQNIVKNIVGIGVSFGTGAGLVAIGFTSPAEIGALTSLVLVALVILIEPPSTKEVKA
ncbi:MAG TPA: hypothetical protein DEQ74_02965, partial [Wolbachia sp.]|nr:hypothetical protein [Wolbachia sp.]